MKLSRRSPTILALMISSLCLVVAAQAGLPVGMLRVPAGIVAALFAPGYATLMVVRPRHLTNTTRLILSVPLSLSIVIAIGVFLDMTPFGIHPRLMTLLISCVSTALIAIGWSRGQTKSTSPAHAPVHRRVTVAKKVHLPAIAALLSVVVAVGVWTTQGIVRASQDTKAPFSEILIRNVAVGIMNDAMFAQASMQLGVNNHEHQAMNYVLRVLIHSAGRTTTLVSKQELNIPSDKSWNRTIDTRIRCGDRIEVQLWLPRHAKPNLRVQDQPVCVSGAHHAPATE